MDTVTYVSCVCMMVASVVVSTWRWRILAAPDRILCLLLAVTCVGEGIAYYFSVRFQNNMYVYHVFSPIELTLFGFYFNEAIPFLKRRKVGILLALFAFMFAIVNGMYFQPFDTLPSLFLLCEAFAIICLSLLSFFSILRKADYKLTINVQFWVSFNLLLYWSFTFLLWGTYDVLAKDFQSNVPYIIFKMLTGINLLAYSTYFIIFLRYPKLIRTGE